MKKDIKLYYDTELVTTQKGENNVYLIEICKKSFKNSWHIYLWVDMCAS